MAVVLHPSPPYLQDSCGCPGEHGDHEVHNEIVHAFSSVIPTHDELSEPRQPVLCIWLEHLGDSGGKKEKFNTD